MKTLQRLLTRIIKFQEDSSEECVSHDVPDSFVMSILNFDLEELKKIQIELSSIHKDGEEYADVCSADTIGGLPQRDKDCIVQGFRNGVISERLRVMELLDNRETSHPAFKNEFARVRSELMGWKLPEPRLP